MFAALRHPPHITPIYMHMKKPINCPVKDEFNPVKNNNNK